MINIQRLLPSPESLLNKKFEGVKEVLSQVFHQKCYLCEQKNPISSEIEHFYPTSKYPDKKYDWENLFFSCHHCNTIKNYVIDSSNKIILNCANFDLIITEEINFICNGKIREKIKILSKKQSDNEVLENTIFLLDKVFNSSTESKVFDSKKLTDEVIKEIKQLIDILHEYEFNTNTLEKKEKLLLDIKDKLSIESPFTAFKIFYIQENYLGSEFEKLLPIFKSNKKN